MSDPARTPWSEWHSLALAVPPTPRVLEEVLDGGQAFRWRRVAAARRVGETPASPSGAVWRGVWADCVARLRLQPGAGLQWSTPLPLVDRVAASLPRYLDAGADLAGLTDRLPWRGDAHLARCLQAFPGLRILRQPLAETLLCFLCSATKQIAQIRQMTDLLALRHGREIVPGVHRLPTWSELALVDEAALRACRLGFRARHIHQVASFLEKHPSWLDQTVRLPYGEARTRLGQLPGVGGKIADCVLLFGAGRLEAFPVDTWITRVMAARYGLNGWSPAQIAHFGRVHFGPLAGLAQQYLFAWERAHGR